MACLKDAVYGLAIGDAMGLPVQFMERDSYQIDDMVGYRMFPLPEGSWSDDTSLTIATCASIKEKGSIDIVDIRHKFENWLFHGAYTPYGKAYDVGNTCYNAISQGKGCKDEWSNGNGSLMRIIPLAFVPNINDIQVTQVSAITHAHSVSMQGCLIYIHIAQGLLEGKSIKECIHKYVDETSRYSRLRYIEKLSRDEIHSSGYVVDTLEAALWCLMTTKSYKECILKAINLGKDTDTIGAVAGGLAGIIYGMDAIPQNWMDQLKAKDTIDQCLFLYKK